MCDFGPCGVGVAVGSLQEADVSLANALDQPTTGLDVEVTGGANGDAARVAALPLAGGDACAYEVAGCVAEVLLGAGQVEAREAVSVGGSATVGTASSCRHHLNGFGVTHHACQNSDAQRVKGVTFGR